MSDAGAIHRVLKPVSLLSDQPRLTAKQAAALLGWPVSTTHRLLRKLADFEFADQAHKGTFGPGMELFRAAGRLGGKVPFVRIAEPLLAALSARFNETSLLTILERRQLRMYVAASASPADPMRYIVEINKTAPLVWGASGRTLLAFLTNAEIQQAIEDCTIPNIRGGHLDPGELRSHLAGIAADGYAITRSHRTLNSVGIAVPFANTEGEVVGSLAFRIPGFRFSEESIPDLVGALRDAASVISQQIGARTDY
jgi:DNA-binding IclR family transcriptional regulator